MITPLRHVFFDSQGISFFARRTGWGIDQQGAGERQDGHHGACAQGIVDDRMGEEECNDQACRTDQRPIDFETFSM